MYIFNKSILVLTTITTLLVLICATAYADDTAGTGVSADGQGSASQGNSGDGAPGASADGGTGAAGNASGESSGNSGGTAASSTSSDSGNETSDGGVSGSQLGMINTNSNPPSLVSNLEDTGVNQTVDTPQALEELNAVDLPAAEKTAGEGLAKTMSAKSDQDKARAAVENGMILPLRDALKQVSDVVSGKVIDVKMSQTSEGSTYHVKVRTLEGEIRNVTVDARTGKILESISD